MDLSPTNSSRHSWSAALRRAVLRLGLIWCTCSWGADALARPLASPADTVAPVITRVSPEPGALTNLTQITVTFSEPVTGVMAADFFVDELPATTVSGSGATYTFTFPQPDYGTVRVYWNLTNGITDLATPPNSFVPTGPGATWLYELIDPNGPVVATLNPPAGLTVHGLTQVEVVFDKPVQGVEAADLLVNGVPAAELVDVTATTYVFRFAALPPGVARMAWASTHGVSDLSPDAHPFAGGDWQYTVNPQAPLGDVVINEFLAENVSGVKDEEGDAEGWIELYNRGDTPVNLQGWALTDDDTETGKWVFPAVTLSPKRYLVVFASGKDRKPTAAGGKLHTNFKLSIAGEYLGLYNAESPRQRVHELAPRYPEQRIDYAYGLDPVGRWRYFNPATPGAANGNSTVAAMVSPVRFSLPRGFVSSPFNLSLSTETAGATIRFTVDGSVPTLTNGVVYTNAIPVSTTRVIRAAAFFPNSLPSPVTTHTYLYGVPAARRYLPALSLVTATNNLYGRTGIMEYSPRNTTQHGIAWERPISAELIRPEDNGGFQADCGLRVQGGGYIRGIYNYKSTSIPESKYSFRLYFRGDYGPGRLNYRLFPDTTVESFDTVSLRAGMNDPLNPYIRDPLVRALAADTGQVASHGTFVNLFLNGVYKGYYNPSERIDPDFLQAYHGGGKKWDLIAAMSELREGDTVAWNALRSYVNVNSPTNPAVYLEISRRLDLTNFVDYLLPLIYADTDDWPHNNWRVARERTPGALFRFYVWDGEWSFGYNNAPSHNTITAQLSNLSPPWGGTEIQKLFTRLRLSSEFRLLFADRVHRHFFNDGALSDARIKARYEQLKAQVLRTISGFDHSIGNTWIPQRRRYLTNHFAGAGLLASSNAPVFSQFGGRVPGGYLLSLAATPATGRIYFTTDGGDPRVPFTGEASAQARLYTAAVALTQSVVVKARTLVQTNWSAVTEAAFQVDRLGLPLRITEIMYHPVGGDAFEFIELQNTDPIPIDLSGVSLTGVEFRFPQGASLAGGALLVLISGVDPAAFARRYPGVQVGGIYEGSLANGGERVALIDRNGRTITSVTYDNGKGWPKSADGGGDSIEVIDPSGDPNDPANWRASVRPGGSPGDENPAVPASSVRLNEVLACNVSAVQHGGAYPDYVELHNAGNVAASLTGWSLTTADKAQRFSFPAGTVLEAGAYLVVWCDSATAAEGLHSGFALSRQGETLFLEDAQTNRVDAVSFGLQAPDRSLGRDAGDDSWRLGLPTPAGPNQRAELGSPGGLFINEFMANALPGSADWIELDNTDRLPVSLQGLYLGGSNALFQSRALSFVAPGGFARLWADEQPGPDHLDFKLPAAGGMIALWDATGQELRRITYGTQTEGVSQGFLPDGSAYLISFPDGATPGESNYLPLREVLINEVLTQAEPPLENAIELYNPTAAPADIGGWFLSDNPDDLKKYRIPSGTQLPAGGYRVFYEYQFNPTPGGPGSFALDSPSGGYVLVSAADANGNLAGYRAVRKFGAAESGVSFGRYRTSVREDFVALSQRTFGADTPASVDEFRKGAGRPNAYPKVGPVVINEILYHPAATTNAQAVPTGVGEFIELENVTVESVPLHDPLHLTNTWRLRGGVEFEFPPGTSLAAGQRLLVVRFDPAADPAVLAAFWTQYRLGAEAAVYGPYRGRLGNAGERLELLKPGRARVPPSPDAGVVPYILVDAVEYSDHAPWPLAEAGPEKSLQRIAAREYGNDPRNWRAVLPSPGRDNYLALMADHDGDGLPDYWEIEHGLDPDLATGENGAAGDPDADGLTNWQEYLAGADPRTTNVLVTSLRVAADGLHLTFNGVAGRSYAVQERHSAVEGEWLLTLDLGAVAVTQSVEITLPLPAGVPSRFFRVAMTGP